MTYVPTFFVGMYVPRSAPLVMCHGTASMANSEVSFRK